MQTALASHVYVAGEVPNMTVCRKTKTKVITAANYKNRTYSKVVDENSG